MRFIGVTGVQTCALPISDPQEKRKRLDPHASTSEVNADGVRRRDGGTAKHARLGPRSEERRVGKECGCRRSSDHETKKYRGRTAWTTSNESKNRTDAD